jgi:Na+-translocating ferredoxin:NAD+ oxidoreductase RnfD subunit
VAGFLTLILMVGHWRLDFLESVPQFLLAVVVSLATEVALSRWLRARWPNPVSAYMTGVSIGILVRSSAFWPYAVGSLLAIAQKYALTRRNQHLFNPSNFGLVVLLLAAPDSVAALGKQWTNEPGVMLAIFTLGFMVIYRLGRLDVVAAYLLAFLAQTLARAAIHGSWVLSELGEALGPPFQLFIFFMMTDPRTTPRSRHRRIAFAVTVAALEVVFRELRLTHAPFYALFLGAPLFMLFEPAPHLTPAATDDLRADSRQTT